MGSKAVQDFYKSPPIGETKEMDNEAALALSLVAVDCGRSITIYRAQKGTSFPLITG